MSRAILLNKVKDLSVIYHFQCQAMVSFLDIDIRVDNAFLNRFSNKKENITNLTIRKAWPLLILYFLILKVKTCVFHRLTVLSEDEEVSIDWCWPTGRLDCSLIFSIDTCISLAPFFYFVYLFNPHLLCVLLLPGNFWAIPAAHLCK